VNQKLFRMGVIEGTLNTNAGTVGGKRTREKRDPGASWNSVGAGKKGGRPGVEYLRKLKRGRRGGAVKKKKKVWATWGKTKPLEELKNYVPPGPNIQDR